jgi:hypothetical protein
MIEDPKREVTLEDFSELCRLYKVPINRSDIPCLVFDNNHVFFWYPMKLTNNAQYADELRTSYEDNKRNLAKKIRTTSC